MSKMSDYLEQNLRKHLFRTGSYTKPTNLYISLHTADPTDAASGAEVSGGGYARVQRDPLDANWTAPDTTGGLTDNAADIVFPTPTANWGTITHFAIWDAASAGNMLVYGALTNAKTVNNGDPAPKFVAGDLDITFQ